MASRREVFCLGCGEDIAERSSDRQSLTSGRRVQQFGTINPVISQFDSQNSIDKQSGSHKKAKCVEDIKIIVHNVVKCFHHKGENHIPLSLK